MHHVLFGLILLLLAGYMVVRWWVARHGPHDDGRPWSGARGADTPAAADQEVDPDLIRQVRQFQARREPKP